MESVKERYDWCPYVAIIEDQDGHTYEQPYFDFKELEELVSIVFGEGYRVVTIY